MAGAYGRSRARPPGTRNPKALPRLLSLLLLAAVAGAFIWATLADPAGHSGHGGTKSVDLALGPNAGHGAAPAPDAHGRAGSRGGSAGADAAEAPTSAAAAPVFRLPAVEPGRPLAPAPDPSLMQKGAHGPLPVVGVDGREPWRVYGAPFDASDKRPRVALVVTGLGFDQAATEAAVTGLPAAVTLAFSAYAADLDKWIERARAVGHEVLLGVPMEPVDFPRSDPGPRALLTALSQADNLDRLHWALARAAGYVGVVGVMGSRFLASGDALEPVLRDLKGRGLMFLDSRAAARSAIPVIAPKTGLIWASSAVLLDSPPSREAIDDRLAEAVRVAKAKGAAVAMASPLPVTLRRIAQWTRGADRQGIALAPITALAGRSGGEERSGHAR